MDEIKINVKNPVATIISEDMIDFVWVPEPIEDVQKREFKRRVKKEIKEKLPVLVKQKLDELQPNMHRKMEEEYRRGYNEGENAGRQGELENLKELRENISNTIKEITDYRKQIIKEAENTIVSMALGFAKNIIGEEVRTNRELIRNQVRKTLEYVIGEGRLIFHVHPDDVGQFDHKEKFIPEKYLDKIEVITDDTVEKGGCILETNSGTIDATVKSKVAELEKSINNGLESDITP